VNVNPVYPDFTKKKKTLSPCCADFLLVYMEATSDHQLRGITFAHHHKMNISAILNRLNKLFSHLLNIYFVFYMTRRFLDV